MLWRAPKVWQDGECFILGGGPSLLRQFDVPESVIQSVFTGKETPSVYSPYLAPIHGKHIIGVNMAYVIGTWIDVLFFGDLHFFEPRKDDVLNWPGLKVTCCDMPHNYGRRIKRLEKDRSISYGLTQKNYALCWNKNSGGAAINLAIHFGVKRIILLGFDMKLDDGRNQHWHKYYQGNPKTISGTMSVHLRGFPSIAEQAKKLGVEILNASPDSAIEVFPKVKLKEVLQ